MLSLETHTLFVVRVKDMDVLSDAESLTYDYYHAHIKPAGYGAEAASEDQKIFRCNTCGYEFVGDSLPADFVCPICGAKANNFRSVESLIS